MMNGDLIQNNLRNNNNNNVPTLVSNIGGN